VAALQNGNQANPSPLVLTLQGSVNPQPGKNKSVEPNVVTGEMLTLGGLAMIPYLARILDITMKNNVTPGDWKKTYSGSHLRNE